ncbi:hypothetical protein KCP73_14175 [Salmonella enterica subsp. enterica]|nr:hypothetical protein KCP73_14175 [Salmonella enterica subsp. enterica]
MSCSGALIVSIDTTGHGLSSCFVASSISLNSTSGSDTSLIQTARRHTVHRSLVVLPSVGLNTRGS